MDLLEFRILAFGGILAVGIVVSVVAVAASTVVESVGRVWRERTAGSAETPAIAPPSSLGAGRARC